MGSKSDILRNILRLLAFVGFLDAAYLTIEHFSGKIPPCTLVDGCNSVLTSQYATLGPVPLALAGVLYYVSLFVLISAASGQSAGRYASLAMFLLSVGLAASLGLIYLQWQVIEAFCFYCLVSASVTILMFALSIIWRRRLVVAADQYAIQGTSK